MPAHPWVTDPQLDAVGGLRHAVTTREGGISAPPYASLNLGLGTDDAPDHVAHNRRRVADELGFARLITPYQVHGTKVAVIEEATPARPRCDAMLTDRAGVLLGVLGADCPGVLLVDETRRALGVVHAGWRGAAGGAVAAAARLMRERYRSEMDTLRALIGPGIGAVRYEVDTPVLDAIRASLPADVDLHAAQIERPTRPGHADLDLQRVLLAQLVALGIPAERVGRVRACTYDEVETFYSFRRDGTRTGRHALVAGWQA